MKSTSSYAYFLIKNLCSELALRCEMLQQDYELGTLIIPILEAQRLSNLLKVTQSGEARIPTQAGWPQDRQTVNVSGTFQMISVWIWNATGYRLAAAALHS